MEKGRSFQKYLPITVGQNFLMFVLESKEGIIVEKLQSVWNNYVAQKLGILKNYMACYHKDDHKEINKYTF